jgi:hypothetical protein
MLLEFGLDLTHPVLDLYHTPLWFLFYVHC